MAVGGMPDPSDDGVQIVPPSFFLDNVVSSAAAVFLLLVKAFQIVVIPSTLMLPSDPSEVGAVTDRGMVFGGQIRPSIWCYGRFSARAFGRVTRRVS